MSNLVYGLDPILRDVAKRFDEVCREKGILYTIEHDTHNEQGYQLRTESDVDSLRMSMEEFIADKWIDMLIEQNKHGAYIKFCLKPLYEYPEPVNMVNLADVLAVNDVEVVKEEEYTPWLLAYNDKLVIPPVIMKRDKRVVDGLPIVCALAKVGGIGGRIPVVYEDQLKYPTKSHARRQKAFRSTFGKLSENFEERLLRRIQETTALMVAPNILATVQTLAHRVMADVPVPSIGNAPPDDRDDYAFDVTDGNMLGAKRNLKSTLTADLNKLRASEIVSALQYELFAVKVPSLNMQALTELFSEHGAHEWSHAQKLAQRIHELDADPVSDLHALSQIAEYQVEYATSPEEMVHILMKQEQTAVDAYKRVLDLCHDDSTTRLLLEEILREEEEHLADMKSMGGR